MATYKCKKDECDGDVVFPDQSNVERATRLTRDSIVVVEDKPAQCNKCGTSYYEWELKS